MPHKDLPTIEIPPGVTRCQIMGVPCYVSLNIAAYDNDISLTTLHRWVCHGRVEIIAQSLFITGVHGLMTPIIPLRALVKERRRVLRRRPSE